MAPGTAALSQTAQMNGTTVEQYSRFYEKLFRLQDDVLAGRHPTIKLPDTVLAQFAALQGEFAANNAQGSGANGLPNPNAPDNSHVDALPLANGTALPGPSSTLKQQESNWQNGVDAEDKESRWGVPPLQNAPSVPIALIPQEPNQQGHINIEDAGFDPILSEKSDVLVRPELPLKLKRKRLEVKLKKHAEDKKDIAARISSLTLNTPDVLSRAQELVKPVSGAAPVQSQTSESFDENSYYSSQANSWSSESTDDGPKTKGVDTIASAIDLEMGEIKETPPPASKVTEPTKPSVNVAPEPIEVEEEQSDRQESYSPPDLPPMEVGVNGNGMHSDDPDLDEMESDYSPPPAVYTAPETNNIFGSNDPGRVPSFTFQGVPMVTNHINSPVAPQPSRVSPLAFGKYPALDQTRMDGHHGHAHIEPTSPQTVQGGMDAHTSHLNGSSSGRDSRRQSPTAPRSGVKNPKKRRKKEEQRQRAARNRVPRSPDVIPYIKEEPLSPPPFSFSEPQPQQRRMNGQYGDDVQVISPSHVRTRSMYYDEPALPPAPYRYHDEPVTAVYAQQHSPVAIRRVERDDQDLRRVASLQYARRPYSPPREVLQYAPPEPRAVRAASHVFIERPAPQQPVYRAESVRPAGPPRYIRSERSLSPRPLHESYVQRVQSPALMAPPPPRTMMIQDQYGNKFYAAPPDPRASVVPRQREAEPIYYERAVTRAPARVYEDDAFARMPPPPPRRYVDHSEEGLMDPRAYRQREYSVRPDAVPTHREEPQYAPREVLDRRVNTSTYDESQPRVEYVPQTRAYSVRPEPARGELVPGPRYGSVQPGRHMGARSDDAPPPPPGYVYAPPNGVEERRYGGFAYQPQPQQQHSRYMEDHEREVVQVPYGVRETRASTRYL